MKFAEEMNALVRNTNLKKQEEIYKRARAIYEGFKSTIKYCAGRGYYQTVYTMPLSESCKKDRVDVLIMLKNIFIEEGFQICSFNTNNNGFIVSWANA